MNHIACMKEVSPNHAFCMQSISQNWCEDFKSGELTISKIKLKNLPMKMPRLGILKSLTAFSVLYDCVFPQFLVKFLKCYKIYHIISFAMLLAGDKTRTWPIWLFITLLLPSYMQSAKLI